VNLGYLKNFEKVLGLCNGIYIALSDHDDIWLPNKIERLVDNIGDYSLIFSDAFYIDNNDNIFSSSIKVYSGFEVFSGKPIKYLAFNNFITGCTALFKRELLLIALPIPTAEQFHDWWIGLVACTMNGLIYLPEPLIFYRRHAGNTIGLRKKGSPLYRFFGFLKKAIDKRALEIQVNRMEMLRQNRIFSDDERKCFQMAFEYFYDRLQSKIHKKAFLIALSNFRYIFPNVFGIYRIKAIIGTLLG
jgi:hypothetical protein